MTNDLGWGENTRTHTFSTGRSATLRRTVNIFAVATATGLGVDMVDGQHDPNLSAGEVVLGILQYLWLDPIVLGPAERAGKGVTGVSFSDLDTAEVIESLELWKEAATSAARFRGDAPRDGSGSGGAGVADSPKPPPRATRRKSGSVPH